MNTTAPPDTTGGAHPTPPTLTSNDAFMLMPNVAQHPATQHGTDVIVVGFTRTVCRPCPARTQCTTAKRGSRLLTFYPRDLHHALTAARTQQTSQDWNDKYKLRAGVEATINQTLDITGIRHARYRGHPKTHLQHMYSAVAVNLVRLHTWWTEHPLPTTRTSHLQRLDYALAA